MPKDCLGLKRPVAVAKQHARGVAASSAVTRSHLAIAVEVAHSELTKEQLPVPKECLA